MNTHNETIYGFSVESVLGWVNVAYLISVGVAAALSVAVYLLSARSTSNKDRELDLYKAAVAVQLENAQREVQLAKDETARVNLEAQQLKNEIKWRDVDDTTVQALEKSLSSVSGDILIIYPSGDPEAISYAGQFAKIFEKTSITPKLEGRFGMQLYGVTFLYNPDATTEKIASALARIGVSCTKTDNVPPILAVGSKIASSLQSK